ncbi:MAG: molybdate ABC transporter substrate-binding protein [Bacillus sp. (in: Bacteria)]|nr:molybdate ABC transporter substrate-binding protein [Bacillus sp. (in: firmicutes)]
MKNIFVLLASLVLLMACATDEGNSEVLYVAAASDLYHALTEIGTIFTEETGIQVEFSFGATGLLTQQIQAGAPFDVFLAAHESFIDRLIDRNTIIEESKQLYAIGRIVLMSSSDEEVELTKEYLLSPEVRHITIANPEHAPYGKAAMEALQNWGIWDEIQPKIVLGENIRQAYQYVESGNAEVGIIASALTTRTELQFEYIDQMDHDPIVQALGIPVQTGNREQADQFIQFVISTTGQDILRQYGFDIP